MTIPSPKALLDRSGLIAKRSFGQNFMADARIAHKIAELCTTPPGGTVVELGAGLGALTVPLAARAARVIAVERDRDLVGPLERVVAEAGVTSRVEIVEADAKTFDVRSALEGAAAPRVLAGNLPYQLTGPILRTTALSRSAVERVVYLVQFEVAQRLTAVPGSAEFGAMTVFTQAAYDVERALLVGRGAFFPAPRVDSAVVVLTPRSVPLAEETAELRQLVSRAFAQRRKKLRNAWRGVLGTDEIRLARAASAAGIDLSARGETLSVDAFGRMATELTR